jgi:hypothetical protein
LEGHDSEGHIVQSATAQSRTGFLGAYSEVEATPGFQAGWSGCMYSDTTINKKNPLHRSMEVFSTTPTGAN